MKYEEFEHLKFERSSDGILRMTINRPEAYNATNARLHWELSRVWATINEDVDTRVVVVTGAGEKAFSAGGDLDWVTSMVSNPRMVSKVLVETGEIVYNMLACEKPVISAINGVAVGAGLSIALMADISIIADDVKLTDGHMRLGVAAGDHAVICWPLLCGMAKAKYYLLTSEFIDGKEAERIGLVSACVPRSELMVKAQEVALKLARGSQQAVRLTKRSLNGWLHMARPMFESSLVSEMLCFLGEDAAEGVAAIREKRAPKFPSANS